jgi:tryptophan-rich sensory protein
MGVRAVAVVLFLGALWDLVTTFRGLAFFFDIPFQPRINPAQFTFGVVVTLVVFGFVLSSHLIWKMSGDDVPTMLLKAAWGICIAVDLYTSWEGTRHFVFYGDDNDPARTIGVAVVSALIVVSTMLLSKLLLASDISGKPFLS